MPGKKKRKKNAGGNAELAGEASGDGDGEAVEDAENAGKRRRALKAASAAACLPDDQDESGDDDDSYEEQTFEAGEGEEQDEDDEEAAQREKRVWRPGIDEVGVGEQLDCDMSTYDMFHKASVEWPCLSFDIVRDDLGALRTKYPMTAYVVAGSQPDDPSEAKIYMMKWSKLYKTNKDNKDSDDDDSDDQSSESEGEDHEATLQYKTTSHPGCVNRIRSMPQAGHIVATWSDKGKVHMWNLAAHKKALDKPGERLPASVKPIFTCDSHKEEGYALDFSPHDTGKFLSGSNDGAIQLWEPVMGGWNVGAEKPFSGHTSSIEDVGWKRKGDGCQHVFASCSADCSVRIWDTREANRSKAATIIKDAHGADVNVLSWSPCVGELLISGSDDGSFKIWDTRNTGAGPMANFLWHRKPITSVDWHPTDETALCVSSADDCVTLWDMAVEDDEVGKEVMPGSEHYPPQLLFLHMGQKEPKEVRWHPQLPGVCISTSGTGFNIFKTCNM